MNLPYVIAVRFAAVVYDPGLPQVSIGDDTSVFRTVLQILFSVMGAVAVFIITLAGFKYVTSGGNPENVAKAKGTIIYAAVGLVVSLIAFSIVTFVVKNL